MKNIIIIFASVSILLASTNLLPFSQKGFDRNVTAHYSRGVFLIVVPQNDLIDRMSNDPAGNFVFFKKTQGFDVDIISIEGMNLDADGLREIIFQYKNDNPLLEYVLLWLFTSIELSMYIWR